MELSVGFKLSLLEQMLALLANEADAWARTSAAGLGVAVDDPAQAHLLAEAYLKGPAAMGGLLQNLIRTYTALRDTGAPPRPARQRVMANGRSAAVQVFPQGATDTIYAGGLRGELVFDAAPDAEGPPAPEQFGVGEMTPGVVGILSAGNFDNPSDVLCTLFVQGKVCVVKPNPANHHTHAHVRAVLAPLVASGFVDFVLGGAAAGQALVGAAKIQRLLMTGSARTYDYITWGGSDEEIAANKAKGTPVCSKPFEAELGSVNPVIVCPGKWSDKEIEAQAAQLALAKMACNGHICASPQVVLTCRGWPQREQFLARLRHYLTAAHPTLPYYPNSDKSYAQHKAASHNGHVCSKETLFPGQQDALLQTDVPTTHMVLQQEAFCPVLAEVPLHSPEPTTEAFLPAAAAFVNGGGTWGSLTCTILIPPAEQKRTGGLLDATVADLQFGSIVVNGPSVMGVLYQQLTWGAYPRHTPADVQSGIGIIHNTQFWRAPSKSVLWCPCIFPAQPKLVPPSASLTQAQLLSRFLTAGSGFSKTMRLVRLAFNAVTGL